jgi:hypothetical protein
MEHEMTGATAAPRRRSRRTLAALAGTALVVMTVGASVAFASSPTPAAPTDAAPAAAPTGAIPASPVRSAELDAAFKAYASCMGDHGVNLPDPVSVSSSDATAPAGGDPGGPPLTLPGAGAASGPVTVVSGPVVAAPDGGTATAGAGVIVAFGSAQAIGTPIDDGAFAAADAVCAPILEEAGIHTGTITTNGADLSGPVTGAISGSSSGAGVVGIGVAGNGDASALAAGMTTYAACMRLHGVDMPDPIADGASGGVRMEYRGDPSAATFRAADSACATGAFPGFPALPAAATTTAP